MQDFILKQKGKDGYYKLWHTPEENVFLFVHSGTGSIELREKSYPLAPGVLCFIGKNKYHYTFPKEPEQYERSKLFLKSEVLDKLVQAISENNEFADAFNDEAVTLTTLLPDECKRIIDIFDRLKDLSKNSKFVQEEICSTAIQLMLILAKKGDAHVKINRDTFQNVINFINRHIAEDLTIDKISKGCYINKYYLCRIFKKKMGITVMEYVLQTRLAMAMELLTKEEMSVTQVGIVCGFSSPSYFSRIFKEKTGFSPMAYKKQK